MPSTLSSGRRPVKVPGPGARRGLGRLAQASAKTLRDGQGLDPLASGGAVPDPVRLDPGRRGCAGGLAVFGRGRVGLDEGRIGDGAGWVDRAVVAKDRVAAELSERGD